MSAYRIAALFATCLCAAYCGRRGSGDVPPQGPAWQTLGEDDSTIFSYDSAGSTVLPDGSRSVPFRVRFRSDTPEGLAARSRATQSTTPPAMLPKKQPNKTVAAGVTIVEINCALRQYRNRRQTLYAEDGEEIESVPGDAEPKWQHVLPSTAMDALRDRVCE